MRALVLAAGLATLAATVALPTAATGAPATPDRAVARAARAVVAADAPGVVVRARRGRHTVSLAAGKADTAAGSALRTSDRFRVGSLTKTYVATVVLQLVAERRLGLDDTLEQRLPGVVPNGAGITLRRLLDHSSGLFNYTDDPSVFAEGGARVWTPLELVAKATAQPPLFAPGARWSYANTNYVLLGLVVEAVTGRSLATELRARILRPLRLRHTTFSGTPRIRGRHAHGYTSANDGDGRALDVTVGSPTWAWAAGALVSTAEDVDRFYRALLGGRLLPRRLLAQMRPDPRGAGFGLGLLAARLPCGDVVGHDGLYFGYRSYVFASRDGDRSVVVLVNTDASTPRLERALQRLTVTAYCGS